MVEGAGEEEEEEAIEEAGAEQPPTTVPNPASIMAPNIQICRLGRGTGARCTIAGAKELIFVLNPSPASGRTSSPPSRPNETGTNSAPLILTY